jgi:hypothetical protein
MRWGALGYYITFTGNPRQFQFQRNWVYYYVALGLTLAATSIVAWIGRRRFGAPLSAIRQDESACEALGVKVGALGRHPHVRDARARAMIERVGLLDNAETPAAGLTLAERDRRELARALDTEPTLLLLDEVMASLNATEMPAMVDLVRRGEGNMNDIRRRSPLPWPPSPRHKLPDADAGRPRSRCHSLRTCSRQPRPKRLIFLALPGIGWVGGHGSYAPVESE